MGILPLLFEPRRREILVDKTSNGKSLKFRCGSTSAEHAQSRADD
jgi:hypothetical protein